MENTKIFLVERTGISYMGYSYVEKAFLSKVDAEYFAWKKQKEISNTFHYNLCSFSVREVELGTIEKSKDFNKFVEEKKKEVKSKIKEKNECSVNDLKEVETLNKEMEFYESFS